MNRPEAKEFLIEECKKLPNRQMCCELTEAEIKRIGKKELNLNQIGEFFLMNDLGLKVEDVSEIRFQAILYFICVNEYTTYDLMDCEIWEYRDEATCIFLENAKKLFEIGEVDDLSYILIQNFWEYARSDKTDF